MLPGIDEYAKQALLLSARVAKPSGYIGVSDEVQSPAFAAAIGLMLSDIDAGSVSTSSSMGSQGGKAVGNIMGSIGSKITGVFGKLRS